MSATTCLSPHVRNRAMMFVPLTLCACAASACFGLGAHAIVVPQALDMPEPPPRVVEVHEPEMPPPISLPEEPVRNTPARPRPPTTSNEPARPPQPPPAEPPADAAKPEEATPRPATTLQTTPTQREEEVERRIQGQLGQAEGDLNRINYQNLSSDGRTQYDMAKRFVIQAREALKSKNLVFANNLAEKAATLATQLSGR